MDLEHHFGDADLTRRLKRMEAEARKSLVERYRCAESGLFYDDSTRLHLSEHANLLASLLGLMDATEERNWPVLLAGKKPARCSVYFTHYLLESLAQMRDAVTFFNRLGQLLHVKGSLPHPGGEVIFDFERSGGQFKARVCLPAKITGEFQLGAQRHPLQGGSNHLVFEDI